MIELGGTIEGTVLAFRPTFAGDWEVVLLTDAGLRFIWVASDEQLIEAMAENDPSARRFWALCLPKVRAGMHLAHTQKPLC